jgi:hypothetical protein
MVTDVLSGIPFSQVMMEENDDIRYRLHSLFDISSEMASIVLFPSGSDAELIPTVAALIRSDNISSRYKKSTEEIRGKTKVFSFISGAGEVGSGTAKASGARHFSNTPTTPSDVTVADGRFLEGVVEGMF